MSGDTTPTSVYCTSGVGERIGDGGGEQRGRLELSEVGAPFFACT
jgi:hypothetical protein